MPHRFRLLLPLLILLLMLPFGALAEESASPLIGNTAVLDRGTKLVLLSESVEDNYDWSSSNKDVATVNSRGKVTGRSAGVCVITATSDDGSSYSCTVTVTQPVTRVSVDPYKLTIDRGVSYTLTPSIRPNNATDKTLTWTSSDETVAKVDQNGVVTAIRAGKATITATAKSGKKDTVRVTVTQPVTGLSLDATSATFDRGKKLTLTATVEPADATTKKLTWTTSDKKIATVNSRGVVTGRKAGTCVITATSKNGISVSCTVTITQPVTRVSVDPSKITIDRGLTYALTSSIRPNDATDKTLVWTSSDETVATVDQNGVVTAMRAGKATITATAKSGKKDTVRVTVTQPVTSLTLNTTSATFDRGEKLALTAAIEPTDATNKKLTWTTSNKKVATVDSRGRVTGRKAGTCVITATAKSGVSVSCTVVITQPVTRVKLPASKLTLERGKTYTIIPEIRPDDATDKTITYTSSDETVAKVDQNGVITALRAGKANILATAKSGKNAVLRLTVTQPVTGLSMSSAATISRGDKLTLSPVISPADATDKKLTWTTSDTSIAKVSSKGVVTARKAGTCVITATAKSGVSVSCTITVTQPVTSVSIPSKKTISRNHTYQLEPEIKPANATDKTIIYQSSNPTIASVDQNGVITARADGKATITATARSGKKDTIRITVETVDVTSLSMNKYYLTLQPGASSQLKATVSPEDASVPGARFHSDDPSVVSVNEHGVITAVGVGSTTIHAVSMDNSSIAVSCRVFVRDPNSKGRLDGIIIGINPGHQIKGDYTQDPIAPGSSKTRNRIGEGCAGVKTRVHEYEVNLDVSLMLRDLLEAEGATVVMTRTANNVNITNIERAQMLNAAGVNLALQIHCNSSATDDSTRKGIELYVKPTDQASYNAASCIIEQMIAQTGAINRGVKKSSSYMSLNWSETPSILVEMGYMSNPEEDVLLSTPSYQIKLVEGMYEGIARYFGR